MVFPAGFATFASGLFLGLAVTLGWQEPLLIRKFLQTFHRIASGAEVTTLLAHNATIWTGAKAPIAQALAVRNGRIAAIGTKEDVLIWQTPDTVVQDFGGAFIMPGLIDAHVHLMGGAQALSWLDLSLANSREQFAAAVQGAADSTPPGRWVMGHGWHEANWGGHLPDASWIDAVSPHDAVVLYRMDVHMVLLNRRALSQANINVASKDPEGGKIMRDSEGRPTGILVDNAIGLVTKYLPPLTATRKRAALADATTYMLSKGVTTACDMGTIGNASDTWDTIHNVYMPAANEGQLSLRIFAMAPLPSWELLESLVKTQKAHAGGFLFRGGLKDFADGSLGSRTALMQEPYADNNSTKGIRLSPYNTLQRLVHHADATGLQIALHAIGDQAVEDVLAWYDTARTYTNAFSGRPASSPRRHRIEHAQHLLGPHTLAAMARQQIVAVVNPLHLLSDMLIMEERLGRDRIGPDRAFAYKAMLKAGVPLAFASDWPVVAADPLMGIYTAVHRKGPDMPVSKAWFPDGAVGIEEALHAHTAGAAFALGLENEVGSLKPGMKADFTVLDANLLHTLEDSQRPLPNVQAVYIDGKCKFGH